MSDPISDMLTKIRNANKVRHEFVNVPSSLLKIEIAKILKEEKFIKDYELINDNKQGIIKINLQYGPNKERYIMGLKRISKPGRRVYVGYKEIPKVRGGLGVAIVSTSKGVFTDKKARREKIGGELIMSVW